MFWKKKKAAPAPSEKSAEELLLNLISYIPEEHKQATPYKICSIDLEQKDYPSAVKSLIKLADEPTHYFFVEYWKELAVAAEKLGLYKEAAYCLFYIEKNRRNLRLPYGWTQDKIIHDTDEPLVKRQDIYVSLKSKQDSLNKMFEEDGVAKMLDKDGFHYKSHGRAAILYYIKQGKMAFFDCEGGMDEWVLL